MCFENEKKNSKLKKIECYALSVFACVCELMESTLKSMCVCVLYCLLFEKYVSIHRQSKSYLLMFNETIELKIKIL